MADKNSFSPDIQKKFDTLPPFVQETIMQSGAKFENINELDTMAQDIINKQNK